MKQSSDDSPVRDLFQRLKDADEQTAPAFDDVLSRPAQKPGRRPVRRFQLALAGSVAALLVAVVVRSQQGSPVVDSGSPVAEDKTAEDKTPALPDIGPSVTPTPEEHVVEIDFDHLRRVVEEHFDDRSDEALSGTPVAVWSSRTESLLAVNLDVPFDQE